MPRSARKRAARSSASRPRARLADGGEGAVTASGGVIRRLAEGRVGGGVEQLPGLRDLLEEPGREPARALRQPPERVLRDGDELSRGERLLDEGELEREPDEVAVGGREGRGRHRAAAGLDLDAP